MTRDEQVPGVLAALGVPGIVDVHVHAMPPRVLAKVWAVFDRAGEVYGWPWPIRYRVDDEQRLQILAQIGVLRHTSLAYAHRPGMAAWLNEWTLAFAADHPQVIASATFYPEPGALSVVTAALDAGARVFKIHAQVGEFSVLHPALADVWALLAERGVPTVAHVGSAPLPGRHTGIADTAELLRRQPTLPLIIAHMGAHETSAFLDLAETHDHVRLDTTMVGTDFMERIAPLDKRLLPRVRELGLSGRVLFGSDFPNIPYPYAHQVQALQRWGLGSEWMRQVLWVAGAALFGAGAVL